MAFDPDLLIKMGNVREVIRDELAGKITTIELIHILFELKKHAFSADKNNKTDETNKTDDLPEKRCGNCARSRMLLDNNDHPVTFCEEDKAFRAPCHPACKWYRSLEEIAKGVRP